MTYACRFCGAAIEPFMDLGRMPRANGFLTADQFRDEVFYRLMPAVCGTCCLFQIVEAPPADRIFHADYPHLSGTSANVARHFAALARTVIDRHLAGRRDAFVVEVGSNDGTMLRHFADAGLRHLGIEPATKVADIARQNGLDVRSVFFNAETARAVRAERGPADAIVGTNVIAHIADVRGVANGVRALLADDGVFVFENIYLGDMIAGNAYDQIYDEHVFTFSASAVKNVFGAYGLEMIDLEHQPTMQGGSMRYTLARTGAHAPTPLVGEVLAHESADGLHAPATLAAFRDRCLGLRDRLTALVRDLRREGKRIAGYGAATKSTVTMNFCGFTRDDISYVVDSTPFKQGKLTPGTHIPVVPPEAFRADPPDCALLFAWNHLEEIRGKERDFTAGGGRWIVPVPEPRVI